METSGFFNANLNNGTYDKVYLAEQFAQYFANFISNGVFADSTELQVVSSAPESMNIVVSTGKAFINGYWYINSESKNLTVSTASGVNSRIDIVVIGLDYSTRTISAYIKMGVSNVSPVEPTLQRDNDKYELKICRINIGAGVTKITQSNLVDTRLDNTVCGIVHAAIDHINTTDFYTQIQADLAELKSDSQNDFDTWFNALKASWTSDAATTLQNHIANVSNPHSVTKTQVGLGNVDNTADINKKVRSIIMYRTDNNGAILNQYTKIASFSIGSTVSYVATLQAEIISTGMPSNILICISQPTMGTNPIVTLLIENNGSTATNGGLLASNFVAVISSVTSSASIIDLYYKPTITSAPIFFCLLNDRDNSSGGYSTTSATLASQQGYVASVTGTQTACTQLSVPLADKLSTARNISLTVDDNVASETFDGSTNLSLSLSSRKVAIVGSDAANSNGWYKVASKTFTTTDSCNLVLAVSSTYPNYMTGILTLHIGGTASSFSVTKFKWLQRDSAVNPSNFIIVVSGNTFTMYVYQSSTQYGRIMFEIIHQSSYIYRYSNIVMYNSNAPESTTPVATLSSVDGGVFSAYAGALSTARNINGVPFDGTADITLPSGLSNYQTTNPQATYVGQFTKIATVTFVTQFQEATAILECMAIGTGDEIMRKGRLYLRAKQQNAMTSSPTVSLELLDNSATSVHSGSRLGVNNFYMVISTDSASQKVIDVYYKPSESYCALSFNLMFSLGFSYLSSQSYSSSAPSGVGIYASQCVSPVVGTNSLQYGNGVVIDTMNRAMDKPSGRVIELDIYDQKLPSINTMCTAIPLQIGDIVKVGSGEKLMSAIGGTVTTLTEDKYFIVKTISSFTDNGTYYTVFYDGDTGTITSTNNPILPPLFRMVYEDNRRFTTVVAGTPTAKTAYPTGFSHYNCMPISAVSLINNQYSGTTNYLVDANGIWTNDQNSIVTVLLMRFAGA